MTAEFFQTLNHTSFTQIEQNRERTFPNFLDEGSITLILELKEDIIRRDSGKLFLSRHRHKILNKLAANKMQGCIKTIAHQDKFEHAPGT